MKHILVFSLLYCSLETKAQQTANQDSVYTVVEVMPEYPGGMPKMVEYVSRSLFMPVNCSKENLSTKVIIYFVVGQEGKIEQVEFKEKIPCLEFENQLRKIFDEMPDWKAGVHQGKPVRVKMTYPLIIDFE